MNIRIALAAACMLAATFLIPFIVTAIGTEADAMCSEPGMCQYGTFCDPPTNTIRGVLNKPCKDSTGGGITKGHCVAPQTCRGDSFSGAGGSGATGLDQVAKILGDLMSKLMQGKPPGGGSPPPSTPPPTNTGSTGCTQTVVVSDIAQLQGNPCATYSPSGSSVGGSSSLLDALNEDSSGVNLSETLLGNINSNTNTNTDGGTALSTSIFATTSVPKGSVGLVPGLPGIFGDFKLLTGGATLVAGSRSEQQNTETSGFYGSGTVGQPQGLVSQWCQSRPWTSNFLSLVIPATFFDGLCASRGYQVGTPVPQQQSPSLQQTVIKANTTKPATATTPATSTPSTPATTSAVPPKVDIWAVPAAVALGARTTIFWNTQGVTNCTETSPDGSFSHNTLSGGAATVPITGATTFSISCDAPDGSHVTGYVVVNLSI